MKSILVLLFVLYVSNSINALPFNFPRPHMRLIEFNETYRTWMTIEEVEALGKECGEEDKHGGFMDITDHPDLSPNGMSSELIERLASLAFPSKVSHQAEVEKYIGYLSLSKLTEFDTILSNFNTRKYNTEDGKKAAHTIRDLFVQYSAGRSDISVQLFAHTWVQPSVIARIEGAGPNSDEVVIISAHEDSISSSTIAPGADDDASGTSCVLEVFRALAENGFIPDRTIEFHTYSAEEVGLWGSQDVASYYQSNGVVVFAQMQLDMTMFVKQGTTETIGIITDYVSAPLTEFVKILVNAYCDLSYTTSTCGYACSDHASWTKAGYAASFPFEGIMKNSDPYIHTKDDLIKYLSIEHGMQFSKLATGFIIELSY